MTIDRIKPGTHEGMLLVLTSRFANCGGKTYVLVDAASGVITAYGPCPNAALEIAGRGAPPETFMEYVNRAVLAAVDGYYLDGGEGVSMFRSRGYPSGSYKPDETACSFFSAEAAALAAAAAGWPDPVEVFRRNGKENA